MCRATLTPEIVGLYDKNLSDLGYEKLNDALDEILVSRNSRDPFPSIREIRDKFEPTLTVEQGAQDLITRAIEAVSMYGYNNPEDAKIYLGEIAWRSLPGESGWKEFCMAGDVESGGLPIATARAQLRDRLQMNLKRNFPSGKLSLPAPTIPPFRTLIINKQDAPMTAIGPQHIGSAIAAITKEFAE